MRNRYVLLGDLPLIAIAAFGAFTLRFDLTFLDYRPEFLTFLIAVLLIKPVILYVFGMYTRYWRYATANDLMAVTLAVSAASIVVGAYIGVGRALHYVGEFSRSVLLIDWLLSMMLIGGLRMSVRVVGEAHQKARRTQVEGGAKRTLVVGAGEAGAMVVREMHRNPHLGMEPAGFIDDDRRKVGKRIHGVAVLGRIEDLAGIIETHRIDEVVIAMPKVPGATLRSIGEKCQQQGIASRTMPGVYELLDGNVSVSRLRKIEIADLLRRAQVMPGPDACAYVAGRTVLVTGAGGSIGFELCRQVAHARPSCLVLCGHGENSIFDAHVELRRAYPDLKVLPIIVDIRDRGRLFQVFQRLRPSIVFHAAAHKHVPLMEENPEEAITNNVVGTANMIDAAREHGTQRFVLISTDKAVAPTAVMGASKRMAEAIVRNSAARDKRAFVVVRFGNVLGSRGSVVPHLKRQIDQGGPVTITHPDMRRFFMTIPEAVHLVLQAGGLGNGGELFVLKMGEPVRIVDLAEDLIKLSGLTTADIPIVFTGIRPGEKLIEALWEPDASVEQTEHPDILRVLEPTACSGDDIGKMLDSLLRAATDGDHLGIEAELARFISSYVPSSVRHMQTR
jgi:FlaA1/EpsC-like NDP-sugar epimerase